VVFVATQRWGHADQNANSQVSIAGGPVRTNNVLVDGISITDSNNRAVFVPRRNPSGSEASGKHLRRRSLPHRRRHFQIRCCVRGPTIGMAAPWATFARRTGWPTVSSRPGRLAYRQSAVSGLGGSLGGPVAIPKLYDGHNARSSSWPPKPTGRRRQQHCALRADGARARGETSPGVPLPAGPADHLRPARHHLGRNAVARCRQQHPANQLDPAGLKLASYYPLPNTSTAYYGATNFQLHGPLTPNRGDQYTFKATTRSAPGPASAPTSIRRPAETSAPPTFGNVATPSQNCCSGGSTPRKPMPRRR